MAWQTLVRACCQVLLSHLMLLLNASAVPTEGMHTPVAVHNAQASPRLSEAVSAGSKQWLGILQVVTSRLVS